MPELLVVSANVPVSNLHELVALAKDKPGQLNFASSGVGSMPHLAGELFKFNAHINIVHVPYRGAAPAITDLLAGHVQMAFLDLPILLPQVRAQTLKAIAVSSKSRADLLKDVPTTAEAGYPQIDAENWVGLVAPAATPPAIIAKLNHAAVEALRSSVQRLMLAASRSKTIREAQKVLLINRVEDGDHRLLDNLILQGRDPQRALSPVAFRDVRPPTGPSSKRPTMHPAVQIG